MYSAFLKYSKLITNWFVTIVLQIIHKNEHDVDTKYKYKHFFFSDIVTEKVNNIRYLSNDSLVNTYGQ